VSTEELRDLPLQGLPASGGSDEARTMRIEQIAQLARISLSSEEMAYYDKQLGAILDYVAKLEKIDVQGIELLTNPAEISHVFRDDVVKPSLSRPEALKNAPERNDDFFIVPKVVEA
jgi:aspartyl-tRNA(Asn)/glutamyl-tRNA(Gln) amidotransferase subunit C